MMTSSFSDGMQSTEITTLLLVICKAGNIVAKKNATKRQKWRMGPEPNTFSLLQKITSFFWS